MKSLIAGIVAACLLAIYGVVGITTIDPGEVGLLIKMLGSNRGMQKETLDTGWYWVEPFRYDVAVYDTRLKQFSIKDMPAQTMDGQPIRVDISLEIGLKDQAVPNLHERIGRDYFDQVVWPATRAAVRNNTSTQLSDNVYTGEGRKHIQTQIEATLTKKLKDFGIMVAINLRDVKFTNSEFVATLEEKAAAAQKVIIETRNAEAAVQTAKRVENQAEGEKQKRIKAAEAEKEEIRLRGLGQRLAKEQEAKGNLALYRAEAEGTRLQVQAYGGGDTYASVKWAEHMGPNVKVYGFPTGAAGTNSFMDLNGIFGKAFNSVGNLPSRAK